MIAIQKKESKEKNDENELTWQLTCVMCCVYWDLSFFIYYFLFVFNFNFLFIIGS